MTPLIRLMESRLMMWICGTCGDSLCTIGFIAAIRNRQIAGFKPTTWVMFAMVFYLYFIMSLLSRILAEIVEQGKVMNR
ncbi:MAG: hypothetical protein JXA49_10535 [Actinobacteria bacterium]|nr:hypothetical protein [Actinomycetota bacterium]